VSPLRAFILFEILPFCALLALVCWGWGHAERRRRRLTLKRHRAALELLDGRLDHAHPDRQQRAR
jgi:hypothetical protein